MEFEFDAVVIGGAFSGAATALLMKRKQPSLRVLIVEKSEEFDRKVGESTTEVSSCFLTRILGLSTYLGHHQLAKQGLRMWFANRADQPFDDCVEVGARYQSRLPSFQVDRAKLDSHLLELAAAAGCEVWRPAKVTHCELQGNTNRVEAKVGEQMRTAQSRWVIDASGRAAFLSRKLGYFQPNLDHPINSVWARFTGVKDWDSYEWREKFPAYANACRTSRSWATNHLMGPGWWCWIIPLKGGDYSAGLVYDSRLFQLEEGTSLGTRLQRHLLSHPIGREIFRDAELVEKDVHAYSALPYMSERVGGEGWLLVGDAAGFIDPLYSPGLDFCAYTTSIVADIVSRSYAGEKIGDRVAYYNEQFPITYRTWFKTLYKDKYFYMGDAELMSAALLLDVGSYFVGLVRPIYANPETEFLRLPFEGVAGRIVGALMSFYNRRLTALGRARTRAGTFGAQNSGWRELYDGFVPDRRVGKLLRRGLLRWMRAELRTLMSSARRNGSAEEFIEPTAQPAKAFHA